MLVAVQSPVGTKRVECKQTDSASTLLRKVQSAFTLEDSSSFTLYKDKSRQQPIHPNSRKLLSHFGLQHGDTLYLKFQTCDSQPGTSTNEVPKEPTNSAEKPLLEEEVDTILFKQNGYIDREKDPKLCSHGPKGKCVHCVPVEPYNEAYLQKQNIKHMSFHSYLRKLTGGIDRGKFAALENISCRLKPGCKEHPPWPQGICTKCQPNALTLNRQTYRHVDNVVFENAQVVERFLNGWRVSGQQRAGILYGTYSVHKDVPLGIKATVVVIYEPPQDGSRDFLRLLPDERASTVNRIATDLGLSLVGWIFTDLVAEDMQKGTVKHLRNINTHFLSAQECIMAGHFQNEYPNPCKLSPEGYFGSKFVTICFTGDAEQNAHMEGYQVSNQCMALVKDSCLLPTMDAPELGYVRESTGQQFVPDVFYKVKDTYGNEVTRMARPLPIEYLLVDVPVSSPNEPHHTFYAAPNIRPFPVENRLTEVQDFPSLVSYLRQFNSDQFLEAMSDFHLLLYLATMDLLPLMEDFGPLLTAIKLKDRHMATEWAKGERWATVEHLMHSQGSPEQHRAQEASSENGSMWICRHCTFLNQPHSSNCEICSLPQ